MVYFLSLVKYSIFQKAAELCSFTKAGEALGLTQSAVSHAISSLENEFGFPLVHRHKNGIRLTAEGELMLIAIRKVLHAEERLIQEAANINGFTKGRVKIGTFSSISSNWMPNLIQVMNERYPGIKVEIKEGDYFEIEQWLTNGEIDCGFLNGSQSNQFSFLPLIKDQLFCIVGENSRFFTRYEVDIYEIELEPFILASYNGTNDVLSIFENYQIKPNVRFELFDEKGIISMIGHHLGISILPQLVLHKLPENVKAIPLQQPCYRTIGLATKHQLSPATEIFIKILKEWLSNSEKYVKFD